MLPVNKVMYNLKVQLISFKTACDMLSKKVGEPTIQAERLKSIATEQFKEYQQERF